MIFMVRAGVFEEGTDSQKKKKVVEALFKEVKSTMNLAISPVINILKDGTVAARFESLRLCRFNSRRSQVEKTARPPDPLPSTSTSNAINMLTPCKAKV